MKNNNYRRVKWALLGAGDFGQYYANILSSLPNVELKSIFSAHNENLNKTADKYNIKKRSTNFKEVIEDDEIEAVAICTSEHHHYKPTMAAIEAGKQIIIEKPIAPNLNEADEMIKAAERKGVMLAVCHIFPFHNHYYIAKNEIQKNNVGEIVSMYSRENSASVWGDKLQNHSSAIYEEMIYYIEYILWLSEFTNQTGWKVKQLYAQTKNIRGYKYPDICWAMFTFENGCIVTLEANWFLPNNTPYLIDQKMEIQGTKGIIYIDVGDQGLKVNDLINGWRYPDVIWWPEKLGNIGGALREEIEYLANCISLGKKPSNELADPVRSRDALEIILAAEKSSEEGKVIYL